MKVKKFVAASMPEAMNLIKKDLGKDAVILHSKVIQKKRFLGLLNRKSFEVIAALDSKPAVRSKPSASEKFQEEKQQNQSEDETVIREIRGLKKWMETHTSVSAPVFPENYQFYYQRLIDQEVDPLLAQELISRIVKQNGGQERADRAAVKRQVKKEISERLAHLSFGGISYQKKFIHLTGPTGVGKTTTIAKLAANAVLKDGKKVALITMDTYRIAAIEQLKTYAGILNVPLEIAYNEQDYRQACQKLQDHDLVIVDTAGRNFREEKYVQEYEKIAAGSEKAETFLVFSLATRAPDNKEIMKLFDSIPDRKFIFTKEDESTKYGAVLNLCLEANAGIAYVTNGQNVPDDIEEGSISKICEMIVGDDEDE